MSVFLPRTLAGPIKSAIKHYPVIMLTGPRQSGKSTLLKKLFPDYTYVNLDNISVRENALSDPELFISNLTPPVIIDEVQYVPQLLNYIKINIDKYRTTLENEKVAGSYLLTGSQAFSLMAGVTESLAGRVAIFELFPLAWEELGQVLTTPQECLAQMFQGFYPHPVSYKLTGDELSNFYNNYVQTYLERDVRQIKNVHSLANFHNFLHLLAVRIGNTLNLQDISKELGISGPTLRGWLSILEASRIIYLLPPYSRNIGKRLIKSPKIYFGDTGLLTFLLGIDSPQSLAKSKYYGEIFENMVVMEFVKAHFHKTKVTEQLFFYRDSNKVEVDLVVMRGEHFDLYEIKSAQKISDHMARHLKIVNLAPPEKMTKTILGQFTYDLPLTPQIMARPWWKVIESSVSQ